MDIDSYNILVVDDEEKLVDVIKSYLEHSGYKVSVAYNGIQALDVFEKVSPSLIILDLMLPDLSGEEVCKIIRKKSRVPIIMVTAKIEEENILNGLSIGADDYITKPFSPKQLVARVIALLRRTTDERLPVSNRITYNKDDLVIDFIKRDVRKNGHIVSLTPKEYNVLLSFVKYPSKTFTRDELICLAMGEDFNGYDRTIDTHIKNLRQKIETDPKNPVYILTVHGVGYRFGGDINEI